MYNLCVTMDICAVLSYTPSSPLMSDLSDLWPLYVYSCFYKPTFLVSAKMYFCIPVKSISHVVLLLPRYQIHLTCVLGSGRACAVSDNWQTRSTFNTQQFILLQAGHTTFENLVSNVSNVHAVFEA